MVQQVRWDKIPSYCTECKHVGHVSDVCYATGKKERPPKRNYNNLPPKKPHPEGHGSKGTQDEVRVNHNPYEWKRQGKKKGNAGNRPSNNSNGGEGDTTWDGPDIMGGTQEGDATRLGTRIVGLKCGDEGRGIPTHPATDPPSPSHGDMDAEWEKNPKERYSASSSTRGSTRGGARHAMTRGCGFFSIKNHMSSNQYYSLMANGEFDAENCGDTDVSIMDMQVETERAGGNPPLDDAEEQATNKGQHLTEFQGGPSSPSGTHPTC